MFARKVCSSHKADKLFLLEKKMLHSVSHALCLALQQHDSGLQVWLFDKQVWWLLYPQNPGKDAYEWFHVFKPRTERHFTRLTYKISELFKGAQKIPLSCIAHADCSTTRHVWSYVCLLAFVFKTTVTITTILILLNVLRDGPKFQPCLTLTNRTTRCRVSSFVLIRHVNNCETVQKDPQNSTWRGTQRGPGYPDPCENCFPPYLHEQFAHVIYFFKVAFQRGRSAPWPDPLSAPENQSLCDQVVESAPLVHISLLNFVRNTQLASEQISWPWSDGAGQGRRDPGEPRQRCHSPLRAGPHRTDKGVFSFAFHVQMNNHCVPCTPQKTFFLTLNET